MSDYEPAGARISGLQRRRGAKPLRAPYTYVLGLLGRCPVTDVCEYARPVEFLHRDVHASDVDGRGDPKADHGTQQYRSWEGVDEHQCAAG